jgi:hypothetical protein
LWNALLGDLQRSWDADWRSCKREYWRSISVHVIVELLAKLVLLGLWLEDALDAAIVTVGIVFVVDSFFGD